MPGHTFIFLVAAGAFGLLLVWTCITTALQMHRLRKNLPPRPPFKCPKCGSEQIEVLATGLWDGKDAEGRHIGGIFEYGTCKSCHGRCARHFDDQPYIPSEAEWEGEFSFDRKMRSEIENWPFDPDEDFYRRKQDFKSRPAAEITDE